MLNLITGDKKSGKTSYILNNFDSKIQNPINNIVNEENISKYGEEIAKLNQAYASATEENERKEIAKQLSMCVQKRNALKKA